MIKLRRVPQTLAIAAACLFSTAAWANLPVALTNDSPLPYTEINQIMTGPCEKDRCSELHVRTIEFADAPAFSKKLNEKLLSMANTLENKPARFETVEQLMAYFERNAWIPTSEYLQANVERSRNNLVVVDLVHYIFSGGAHGETTSQYVNWIPGKPEFATLETMLLPGAKPKFEARLKQQHELWLKDQHREQAIDDIKVFEQTWPFAISDNVALAADGLKVTYQRYAIGPGSFGQPSLTIPYSMLTDILKPEYLRVALNR